MKDFNLKVNDRIEVMVEKKAYKTLIIDVQDGFLRINLPVVNGEYLMVHINERIEINSYSDDGGCYKFYSKVISRGKEGNIIYYQISKPFDIKKIQRRNFFRVGLLEKIEYKIVTNINTCEFNSVPYKAGFMVDLSGGGLKLKAKDDIKTDDLLLIKMIMKNIPIEFKCSIVRIENTPEKEKLCGLKFMDITPAQSESIIQELFEIIRKQRAKS